MYNGTMLESHKPQNGFNNFALHQKFLENIKFDSESTNCDLTKFRKFCTKI